MNIINKSRLRNVSLGFEIIGIGKVVRCHTMNDMGNKLKPGDLFYLEQRRGLENDVKAVGISTSYGSLNPGFFDPVDEYELIVDFRQVRD